MFLPDTAERIILFTESQGYGVFYILDLMLPKINTEKLRIKEFQEPEKE